MGLVYKITHIESGLTYVGMTQRDLVTRWKYHCYDALRARSTTLLHTAIRLHGADAFRMEILEDNIAVADLGEKERHHIQQLKTIHPNGYNQNCGGIGGGSWSEEHKEWHSYLMRGNQHLLGYSPSLETRAKISLASRNRLPDSEETKLLKSISKSGNLNPMYGKPSPRRGVTLTEETKRKISESRKRFFKKDV